MGCIKSKEVIHIDSISQQNLEPNPPVQHFIKETVKQKSISDYNSSLADPLNNDRPINKVTKVENFRIEDNYKIVNKIGKGNNVFKVKNIKTEEIKVMKIIKKEMIDDDKNFINEIKTLTQLENTNINKLNEYFIDDSNYYLISNFIPNGELSLYLSQMKFFNEQQTQYIMSQLLNAVNYIHNNNIIHSDITLDHILVDKISENANKEKFFMIKLIDVGIANFLNKQINYNTFISPEVIDNKYSYKCDIWSCGVIMYMLLKGESFFKGNSKDEIYKKIRNEKIDFDNISGLSRYAKDLLSKMLERDPEKRFAAKECLKHKWMKLFNERKSENNNANSTQVSSKNIKDLSNSNAIEKLQNSIINYINHYVSYNSEEEQLNKIFKQNDKKGKGMISFEDCEHLFNMFFIDKANVQNYYQKSKIVKILEKEKQIKKGYISNEIFNKVAIEQIEKLNETNLKNAFDKFHMIKNDILSKEEIQSVLSKKDFKYKKEILNQINSQSDDITYDILKRIIDTLLQCERNNNNNNNDGYNSDDSLGYISEEKKANKFDREKFLLLIENEHTHLSDSDENTNAVGYTKKSYNEK